MKTRAQVALLRGINVGGNHPVKMDALRQGFESLGLHEVKTILASGNILFETTQSDKAGLRRIKEMLAKKFGLNIGVIMRSIEDMQEIALANPFGDISITPDARLYVTFLAEKTGSKLKAPFHSPTKDFCIVRVSGQEVFSELTLSAKTQSSDLMTFIEKEFGKEVTTRNWNTVLKIAGNTIRPA